MGIVLLRGSAIYTAASASGVALGWSFGVRALTAWKLEIMATLVSPLPVTGAQRGAARGRQGSGGSFLERLSGWIAEQRRYRRTLAELSTLTDRELDDIGLNRGDLESVARRSSRDA